jgi:hypothetical protein
MQTNSLHRLRRRAAEDVRPVNRSPVVFENNKISSRPLFEHVPLLQRPAPYPNCSAVNVVGPAFGLQLRREAISLQPPKCAIYQIFQNLTAVKDYANQFSHNRLVLLGFAKLHDNAGRLNGVV